MQGVCGVHAGSSLAVEGLTWGQTGPFAFNMWVKQANNSGSMFQYLLSTRARTLGNITDDSIFYPNQVGLHVGSRGRVFSSTRWATSPTTASSTPTRWGSM